jgi:hypothetical protein
MSMVSSMDREEEEGIEDIDGKARRKESTRKTET